MNKDIHLLRSFVPQKTDFGINGDTNNQEWYKDTFHSLTFFRHNELLVEVMFIPNVDWNCTELVFATVLKSKVRSLVEAHRKVSFLRDEDMPHDPNQATEIFRKVTWLALQQIPKYGKVGFRGAIPKLDQIYGRLVSLRYFRKLCKKHGFKIYKIDKDLFIEKV